MAGTGWGNGAWGTSPWGGVSAGHGDGLAFFTPPTVLAYPSRDLVPNASRPLKAIRVGVTVQAGSQTYQGGRWFGPLPQVEIDAITAAGYGARIIYVGSATQLPAGLD